MTKELQARLLAEALVDIVGMCEGLTLYPRATDDISHNIEARARKALTAFHEGN